MEVISIFILGVVVLAGAILLNVVATKFGLMSWYDFIKNPGKATPFSLLWLFFLYPFSLGLSAFIGLSILGF